MKAAQDALKASEQEDVDFTDTDLNDPELLAEMARLERGDFSELPPKSVPLTHGNLVSGMDVDSKPIGGHDDAKVSGVPNAAQGPRVSSHGSSSSAMDVTGSASEASEYEESIKALVNQRIREYLTSALKAKEMGLPQARSLALTHAKLKDMKKKMEEEGELVDEDDIPGPPPPLPSASAEPTSSETPSNTPSRSLSDKSRSPTAFTSPTGAAASPTASPSPVRPSSPPTDLSQSQMSRSTFSPPLAQLSPEELREKKFTQLESVIVSQLEEMKKAVLEANAANRKAEAMAIVTKRKSVLKDLELIRFARSVPGTPPPAFHIDTIEEIKDIVNEDLSLHEVEIGVLKLDGVKPPSVADKVLECYVQVECPFPDPSKPTISITNTVGDSLDPVFKFTQRIRIERNKALGRTFQKKRIVFSIYKPKSWFLGSARLLGKAELRLATLCDVSEVHEALDVLDAEGHKLIGGKIHVFARLRTPLLKRQITKETHKVLVIDRHFIGETVSPALPVALSPGLAPSPSRPDERVNEMVSSPDLTASTVASLHGVNPSADARSTPSSLADSTFLPSHVVPPLDLIDFQSDAKPLETTSARTGGPSGDPFSSPPNASPSPISTATSTAATNSVASSQAASNANKESAPTATQPATSSEASSPDNFDWNSAKWMISHSVLGWRKEALESEIAAAKAKKMPQEEVDELEAKKDDVEHKITILIVLVQSGQLSEEEYIRRVKVKIGEEEELAQRLASINRREDVSLCKKRIQIMKEEIGIA